MHKRIKDDEYSKSHLLLSLKMIDSQYLNIFVDFNILIQKCIKERKSKINSVDTSDNLSILMYNAQSVKNKLNELSQRISEYDSPVVFITESWLDQSIPCLGYSEWNMLLLEFQF